MAKVTKKNVVKGRGKRSGCKRIKGGRAGCYIMEKGNKVFRFVKPSFLSSLSGLGIPIVGAGKLLPGFTGKGRKRKSRKKRKTLKLRTMRPGCKKLSNGRIGCPTKDGFRIIG